VIEISRNNIQDETIAFIGSGTMGEAMIKGLLRQRLLAPERMIASDVRPERIEQLTHTYQVRGTSDNRQAAQEADIVVLSIKPQVMKKVLAELNGATRPSALILSIAAGVPTHTIMEGLAVDTVVRAMPNTPAQLGLGMTVWTATPGVTETQL